jgi:hypothetical protein
LNATFNRDAVTYCDVTLDEYMRADVAIAADLRLRENDAKLPHSGARSDARSFCLRGRVDLFLL